MSFFVSIKAGFVWLILAMGIMASIATSLGFLGRFFWVFELFSHFRVQYTVGLLTIAFLSLHRRYKKAFFVFLAFGCLNFIQVVHLYVGRPEEPYASSAGMRAMLFNVNTHYGDVSRVQDEIQRIDPDILVLQEISDRWVAGLAALHAVYPYTVLRPRADNFGIGLYSKFELTEAQVVFIGDAGVPSIVAMAHTPERKLHVVATHPLPPVGRVYSSLRNQQLEQLPAYLKAEHPVLMLGDLNTTPWNFYFRRLLAESGLRDSAKGFGVQATWPNVIALFRIPIDHCLHSSAIFVVDRTIGNSVSSDHHPVIVDFVITGD